MRCGTPMTPAFKLAILTIAATCLMGQPPAASAEGSRKLNGAVTPYTREVGTLIQKAPNYEIFLTYPAGYSPKVFTKGWVFGARCIEITGAGKQADISGNVRWKGTGTFMPDRGPLSRPVFNIPGTNRITLSVEKEGRTVCEKTFTVEAVYPTGYASVGGMAHCPTDVHGCPACPHPVSGPILSGSPNVFINGVPAARLGDTGRHAACCGPNTFVIKTGDPQVLIDGRPAARLGDQTQHCGGTGRIISASGQH